MFKFRGIDMDEVKINGKVIDIDSVKYEIKVF